MSIYTGFVLSANMFYSKLLIQDTRSSHSNCIHKKVTAGDSTRPAYFRVGSALHPKARLDPGPHCLNFVFYALLKTYFSRKPHLIEFKTKPTNGFKLNY